MLPLIGFFLFAFVYANTRLSKELLSAVSLAVQKSYKLNSLLSHFNSYLAHN